MGKSRSPIREDEKPLQLPGESLRDRIDDYVADRVLFLITITTAALLAAFASWLTYFSRTMSVPILMSLTTLIFAVYLAIRIPKAITEIRLLRRGMEGERAVAAVLETLRSDPSVVEVLHDIPRQDGDRRWNIDHLIVSTKSLFVIETKARGKRDGEYRATFDGSVVSIVGPDADRDPVHQAQAMAGDVQRYIARITGNKPHVRPVVLFPGWFIEIKCNMGGPDQTWAMNPKMLAQWMRNEPERISRQDAALYAERLRQWSREGAANAKAKAK